MIENNDGSISQNHNDSHPSLNKKISTNNDSDTVIVQGTKFTKEEIEQANKPQPNVILDKVSGPNSKTTRDNERVADRANEAADSTDSNSGGIIAGGAKGVNQS